MLKKTYRVKNPVLISQFRVQERYLSWTFPIFIKRKYIAISFQLLRIKRMEYFADIISVLLSKENYRNVYINREIYL